MIQKTYNFGFRQFKVIMMVEKPRYRRFISN